MNSTYSMDYAATVEDAAGEEVETVYRVTFSMTPYSPAVIHADPDDCHDAEGGEVEDLTVYRGGVEVDEALWDALGIDRDELREACEEYAADSDEAQYEDAMEQKRDR